MKHILLLSLFIPSFVFAATERITYAGSRSDQQINLQEDYYQTISYTEQVPVSRTVCSDVPVTQNYCEWVASQRICQTRPICHPTPYGPRCVPTYGCYNTPARQFCRPVTTVQRQCGQRTFYEQVTRTQQRFMYRSQADLRFSFSEIPREFSFIEFDVNLIDDQLNLVSNDFNGPVIISKLLSRNGERRGLYRRDYQISSMSRAEYLAPVSQIPVLSSFNESDVTLEIAQLIRPTDVKLEITIRHLRSNRVQSLAILNPVISSDNNTSSIEFSLARELQGQWRYWRNNIRVMDVRLIRVVDGEVINSDIAAPAFVQNRFYF